MSDPRPRGGKTPRQKWVDYNHRARQEAKKLNGGTLPYSPALETSDFPNKDIWSEDNLPEILFYLIPPQSQYAGQKPGVLLNMEGAPVIVDNHPVKDFEVLPRSIAVDVKGWLVEAWRRTDPRIKYQDILDRMTEDLDYCGGIGLRKPNKNSLQNECRRSCRKILNAWVEYGRRNVPHRTEVEAIERLSYQNVVWNTVLPLCTQGSNRLVKLRLVRKTDDGSFKAVPFQVTVANFLQTTLPLHHFLDASLLADDEAMSPEMLAAVELLHVLQERADVHGFSHWSKLERTCLPVSWFDRTKTKSLDNQTYDGGCEQCTWYPTRDSKLAAERAALLKYYQTTKRDRESSTKDDEVEPPNKRRARVESRSPTPLGDEASPTPPPPRPMVKCQIKYLESDEEDDGSYDAEAELEDDDDSSEQDSGLSLVGEALQQSTGAQNDETINSAYRERCLVEDLSCLGSSASYDEYHELGVEAAAVTRTKALNSAQTGLACEPQDCSANFLPDFLTMFGHSAVNNPELPPNDESFDESTVHEPRAIQQYPDPSSTDVTIENSRRTSSFSTQTECSEQSSTLSQFPMNQQCLPNAAAVKHRPTGVSEAQNHNTLTETQLQTQRLQYALAMAADNAGLLLAHHTDSNELFESANEVTDRESGGALQLFHSTDGSHQHGMNDAGSLVARDAPYSPSQDFAAPVDSDRFQGNPTFTTLMESVELPPLEYSEIFDGPYPQALFSENWAAQGEIATPLYAYDINLSQLLGPEPERNPTPSADLDGDESDSAFDSATATSAHYPAL